MSERCGSYPLMNLAQDFGVDYGDVLLLADRGRQFAAGEGFRTARYRAGVQAGVRIASKLSANRFRDLMVRVRAHAAQRWGAPA